MNVPGFVMGVAMAQGVSSDPAVALNAGLVASMPGNIVMSLMLAKTYVDGQTPLGAMADRAGTGKDAGLHGPLIPPRSRALDTDGERLARLEAAVLVAIPDLTGLTRDAAAAVLVSGGFTAAFTYAEPSSGQVSGNLVLLQEPASGSLAAKGSEVSVICSHGLRLALPSLDVQGHHIDYPSLVAALVALGLGAQRIDSEQPGFVADQVIGYVNADRAYYAGDVVMVTAQFA